jgi:hypothetical protein
LNHVRYQESRGVFTPFRISQDAIHDARDVTDQKNRVEGWLKRRRVVKDNIQGDPRDLVGFEAYKLVSIVDAILPSFERIIFPTPDEEMLFEGRIKGKKTPKNDVFYHHVFDHFFFGFDAKQKISQQNFSPIFLYLITREFLNNQRKVIFFLFVFFPKGKKKQKRRRCIKSRPEMASKTAMLQA